MPYTSKETTNQLPLSLEDYDCHQLAQNQQIPIARKTIVTILQLAQIHLQRKAAYILAATVFNSW